MSSDITEARLRALIEQWNADAEAIEEADEPKVPKVRRGLAAEAIRACARSLETALASPRQASQPSDARTEPAPIDADTVRTLVNGHESYCIYYDGAENECSCGYDAAAIRADQWLDLHLEGDER